jgi:hypothetical protein
MMTSTKEGSVMPKKYIVRLSDSERATLTDVVKKLKGSSMKVRRAQILLKADANVVIGIQKGFSRRFDEEPWLE